MVYDTSFHILHYKFFYWIQSPGPLGLYSDYGAFAFYAGIPVMDISWLSQVCVHIFSPYPICLIHGKKPIYKLHFFHGVETWTKVSYDLQCSPKKFWMPKTYYSGG